MRKRPQLRRWLIGVVTWGVVAAVLLAWYWHRETIQTEHIRLAEGPTAVGPPMGGEAFTVMFALITILCGLVLGTVSYLCFVAGTRHRHENALLAAEGRPRG